MQGKPEKVGNWINKNYTKLCIILTSIILYLLMLIPETSMVKTGSYMYS